MRDRNLDVLVDKVGSKYTLVVAVAKRGQQIRNGSAPRVDTISRNPVTVSLQEIGSAEVRVDPAEYLAAGAEPVRPQAQVPDNQGDLEDDLFALADMPGDGSGFDDDAFDEELDAEA
jgi:DNA-directed RNA polymerase subunit omega